jgi:hypothetical protein
MKEENFGSFLTKNNVKGDVIMKMMNKMGYNEEKGLGKNEQGRINPIKNQKKTTLGVTLNEMEPLTKIKKNEKKFRKNKRREKKDCYFENNEYYFDKDYIENDNKEYYENKKYNPNEKELVDELKKNIKEKEEKIEEYKINFLDFNVNDEKNEIKYNNIKNESDIPIEIAEIENKIVKYKNEFKNEYITEINRDIKNKILFEFKNELKSELINELKYDLKNELINEIKNEIERKNVKRKNNFLFQLFFLFCFFIFVNKIINSFYLFFIKNSYNQISFHLKKDQFPPIELKKKLNVISYKKSRISFICICFNSIC